MKLLLDTHVFLWSLLDSAKLSAPAQAALKAENNTVFVSAVTFWEIAIKFALGKLDLRGITPEELPDEARKAGYILLPLDAEAAATSHKLSATLHRDPFDRIITWQTIQNGMTLISRDRAMSCFEPQGLSLLW